MKTALSSLLLICSCIVVSAQAQSSAERAKLIEEAKKEGKVVFYTGASASDGNALKSAFEKKYPFIKMEYFRAGKDKLLGKYLTEARNNTFLADVYQGSVFPLATLQQRGLLTRYRSPERDAIHDSLRPKDDYWAPVVLNAMTIAYNTRLVKGDDIPKSYEDLLLPKWKGRLGLDLNKTEWYVAMLQVLGQERGRKYMDALSKQSVQARDGNTIGGQLLAAGEYSIVVSQYPTSVEEMKKSGAPIEWIALQPHLVYAQVLALTAKNSHPAAGKLFIDYCLSMEGQTVLKGLSRITVRKDVLPNPPKLIEGHQLLVVNPVSPDDYNRYNNEYHKYFRGKMKIADVKTIRLRAEIPAAGQVFSRSGVRNTRSTTLIKVETDDGIYGLGSASGNGELIELIVARVLKPLLVGMDPTDIDEIWDTAYVRGGHKEFGTRGIGVVALSGIDIALWDILGKARGVPLYQLLGGKVRDKVPVYATALYPEEPSKVARRARGFAEQGFHGVKIKVGFDLDQDIRIVRAVRQELGKDFIVMTDANQGYSIDVGIKAAQAFADAGAFWLEEPLFVEDIEGHAILRERGNTPIAVGENLHMTYGFENFILRGAVDFIQPDVARAGGITEIRKITALAAKHKVPVSFHTWGDGVALAASVHLSAALQDCIVMELDYTYNPLREELLQEPFKVDNGYLTPSDKPGLGIELNQDALQRFAFAGAEDMTPRQKTLR